MIQYSQKTAKNGRVLYFADNKLTKKANIPEVAVILDQDFIIPETVEPPVEPVMVEEEPAEKICVACGTGADRVRFLDMRPVNLCEEHYHQLTLGEVAQAVRENA